MAWANKYKLCFQSVHGIVYTIWIQQDGYSGDIIQRSLGRPPVLKKKKSGPICGTSLELYVQCDVDGELTEFYTSNPKEFKVVVYRGSAVIWTGFISTELYAEPAIAPPYDVEVVATDGLGELKLNYYEAKGDINLSSLFVYLLSFCGYNKDIHFAWSVSEYNESVSDFLDSTIINLDYMEGETIYEVLTYVLNSFHATIQDWGQGRWLISRETDMPSSGSSISTYYIPAGGGSVIASSDSSISKSAGQMGVADMWPVGNYSSKIEPARKSVIVASPWHSANMFFNPELDYATGGWGTSGLVDWEPGDTEVHLGYYQNTGVWRSGALYQDFQLSELKYALEILLKIKGDYPHSKYGVYVRYQEAGSSVYHYGTPDGWQDNDASFSPGAPNEPQQAPEYEDITVVIPSPGISNPGTLRVYIWCYGITVTEPDLTVYLPTKGYRDTIHIDNDARGEGEGILLSQQALLKKMN